MPDFQVVSPFRPAGDQPEAIAGLVAGLERGDRYQTLLGITGSGKTATIAWTIESVQRPTLIIEPNKSLAAQLAAELKEFFPHNRVEYFVSYYDYYQPEAYVPSSDTYIEKDSSINDEIDRLRHACTSALLLRPDTIVVASVSCIYGLGSPDEYRDRIIALHPGEEHDQRSLLRRLVELQYSRNDVTLARGQFRARGDTVEIHAAYESHAIRIEFFGDTVERIRPFDVMTGEIGDELDELVVFANTHYGTGDERLQKAVVSIETELRQRLGELTSAGKLLEAQRLRMRTEYDLEMLAETGVCSGIENYSRHLDGRSAGEAPFTLLDFFPKDFLVVLDESHVAVPQLRGQYAGDRSRKETLVDHGFRLPSAMDNRPLRFEEFTERTGQTILLSATPGPWELEHSATVVEQVIRPTGLVDPEVDIRPTTGQIDDLRERIDATVAQGNRVLVTTLTKKMAEDLTDYLAEQGVRVQYLHSDVDTMARIEILRELRLGTFDVLVGINLLREGLDLPEVALVAILDADKEGFLRIGLVPHPDHGSGGPQRQRAGGHVRRHHHQLHDPGHRGDPAAAGPPDRLQRGPRHRPPDHHQVGHRHPGTGAGRRRGPVGGQYRGQQPGLGRAGPLRTGRPAVRRRPPGRGGGLGPGDRPRRRRALRSHPPAQQRDGPGRRGAPFRRGRPPARRDHRAADPADPGPGRRIHRAGRGFGPVGRRHGRRRVGHRPNRRPVTAGAVTPHRYPQPNG